MLLDDEKVYAFKCLLDASRNSGLPFTTRRDLAEKWLAEIDLQMERNDADHAKVYGEAIAAIAGTA